MTNKQNPLAVLGTGAPEKGLGVVGGAARKRVGSFGKDGKVQPQSVVNGFRIALDILINFTCDTYGITPERLRERTKGSRSRNLVHARRFFCVIAHDYVKPMFPQMYSMERVGAEVEICHATMFYHLKTHDGLMEVDPQYRSKFNEMSATVQDKLDESSVPTLLSMRDATIMEITLAMNRLKTIDRRLKMHNIQINQLNAQLKNYENP